MPLKILPILRPAFRAIAGALLTLGLLAGCSKEKKQDRLLESADKYFDAGEYDKARIAGDTRSARTMALEALELDPAHPKALLLVAETSFSEEERASLRTRLEELSKSSPSRPPGTSPPHPSPSARATFPPPRTT